MPQVSLGLALVFGEIYGCVGEPSAATVAERVAVRPPPLIYAYTYMCGGAPFPWHAIHMHMHVHTMCMYDHAHARLYRLMSIQLGALVRRDQHGHDGSHEDARPARP